MAPEKSRTLMIQGSSLSPGLAQGTIHLHRSLLGPIDIPLGIQQHNVEEEFVRLDAATMKISDDLVILATRVEKEVDQRLAGIFGAHKLIAEDSSLREELRREILENLVSASTAVKTVFLRWEKRFLLMESQISRDKGIDMRDVSIRLSNALMGITIHPLEEIPPHSVFVGLRLLPSDVVFLAGSSTEAVLLEFGSRGSHAALFLREMGIPCISGVSNRLLAGYDGDLALVDADAGTIAVHPAPKQRTLFEKKVRIKESAFLLAKYNSGSPAKTKDNVTIPVLANVGSIEDTEKAMANGADGVGLFRMERIFLGRSVPPTKDELLAEMRQILEAAKGRVVYVRLLDLGTDKQPTFMTFLAETNPALGLRGIRLLGEYPELLQTCLRAILELSNEFDLRILIPMVTLPEDVILVKNILIELGSELNLSTYPLLGAMIETPAAALGVQKIAKYVDFLSFGTNDLTQYLFAADRENAAVERYYDDASDILFQFIRSTHEKVPDVPLSLCGELAGRPESISRLLQCGIRTLSVAPPLIPAVKEVIRNSECLVSDDSKPHS